MKIQSKRERLLASSMFCGVAFAALTATSASAQQVAEIEELVVTGTRVQVPGLESASPIVTVGTEEIALQQQPEVEKIIRFLPISVPSDGDAVNNGTAGVSTINLRGLGAQRNLVLIDGQRVIPYNTDGRVDVSVIPTAFLERIDVITGGASAVYGSDAISGAVNFILKKDFEGVELDTKYSVTGEGDGEVVTTSLTLGSNVADGRGNVAMSMTYSKREGVLLGARPLGNLGIVTATGANYQNFLDGIQPTPAPAGCGGPNSVAAGGSTTTVPTRTQITGVGAAAFQFREDGTLGPNCGVFNFNPYNYYQTPLERYGATAIGHYEIADNVEAYARVLYSSTNVTQQVAPSGIFGNSFMVPLANPFLTAQAQSTLITAANAALAAGTLPATSWDDVNNNGTVDAADDLSLVIRRRTGELGPRSTEYDNNTFQFTLGLRGTLMDTWNWDVYLQKGQVDRTNISRGYTNTTNFGNALNAVSPTECRVDTASCVPINVFGAYGTITPEAAAYSSATAIIAEKYEQTVFNASVSGELAGFQSPWASAPVAAVLGVEYREEKGSFTPDECWKLAPVSCLGGAGGNQLPISGGFDAHEIFGEMIVPIAMDQPFARSLGLELGYRYSDYNPTGANSTWKAGINYEPIDGLRFRVMRQRAARAPNIGELAAPVITALRNADYDYCSVGNPNPISAELAQRCIATGMTAAQVGTVQDIVSGQINTFEGTDLANLPDAEVGNTTTVGVVWEPTFLTALRRPVISVDYYDIEVKDYISAFSAQETLDGCYVSGIQEFCDRIVRVNGDIASPGSGVQRFTTNLDYIRAEGIEASVNFGLDLDTVGLNERWGSLAFSWTGNYYLTNESRSSQTVPEIDCLGYFGTSCGNPTHEFRFVQRTTWTMGDLQLSYLWRYLGEVEIEEVQKPNTFDEFEEIEAYNYVDLAASYAFNDTAKITFSVQNVFDKDPPVLGNEAATTSANSGNTLPSAYDALGRIYAVGLNLRF
ncbi:MAG: TonB-dependent receptor domain-containing protein [Phenylobacterium sp.]|uniref:TonB-dependent receptor domain-containing protein n=1 Tax=Phenylobacterium sp. TaxID=1871053 RepID=UPI00391A336A